MKLRGRLSLEPNSPSSLEADRGNVCGCVLDAPKTKSRMVLLYFVVLLVCAGSRPGLAAQLAATDSPTAVQRGSADGMDPGEEHGLSAKAVETARPFKFAGAARRKGKMI